MLLFVVLTDIGAEITILAAVCLMNLLRLRPPWWGMVKIVVPIAGMVAGIMFQIARAKMCQFKQVGRIFLSLKK